MLPDQQLLLQSAISAARSAGQFLQDQRGTAAARAVSHKESNDFVTQVDLQSEALIVERLSTDFPDISIIGEEGANRSGSSPLTWVIDPLDGTTNFIQNIPAYSVSIGLLRDNQPIVGVVYDPNRDELFSAARGQGVHLNGNPVTVSSKSDFSRAVLATSLPHRRPYLLPAQLATVNALFLQISDIRRWGSAALDLAYTACGRFDGYWEPGLNPWDIAAGILMVQEAGGMVTDYWNEENYLQNGYVIAAAPQFHQSMFTNISRFYQKGQG